MTDVQKILVALADCYHHGQIGEEDCQGVAKALNGIPEVYHMDALKSFLGIQEDQPEEQPEDYLAVKTYTSDKFSVGDEVEFNGAYGRKRGVVLAVNGEKINIISSGGVSPDCSAFLFTRTGRNFPAIPAILEELKKA